jgi:hypothetical protein
MNIERLGLTLADMVRPTAGLIQDATSYLNGTCPRCKKSVRIYGLLSPTMSAEMGSARGGVLFSILCHFIFMH